MKKLILTIALISSTSAFAASDLYVKQAAQKTATAQIELQKLEENVPAVARKLVQTYLAAVKLSLEGAQQDLALALDPNAPGQTQAKGYVCSTKDTFDGKIFTGRAQTKMEAENAAQTACINAKGSDFWCKGAITCEQITQ